MVLSYDVYGLRGSMTDEHLGRLGRVLGVEWERRESSYRGTYFRAPGAGVGGDEILVQANDLRDESGSYLQLPDFPGHRFLLFLNAFERPEEARRRLAALPEWEPLRQRSLD